MALAFTVYFGLLILLLAHSALVHGKKFTPAAWLAVSLGPILLMALVLGFRYDVGMDYMMYAQHFDNIGRYLNDEETYEPVYELINIILGRAGAPLPLLFMVTVGLETAFFYMAFEDKQEMLPFAVLFYFITGQIFYDLNIVRHAIATMIFIWSLRYLDSGEFWKYLLGIAFASCFHIAASVLILVWFLRSPKRLFIDRPSIVVILFIITLIIGPIVTKTLFDPMKDVFEVLGYKNYIYLVEDWEMDISSGMGMYLHKALDLVTILLGLKFAGQIGSKSFNAALRTFIIGAWLANIFGLNMLLSRIPFSLTSLRILILPVIAANVLKDRENGKFTLEMGIMAGVMIIYLVLFVADIAGGASKCSPFQFYSL
ncbi:MAG: EpsG family protein [Bacteroidales bacterium]|nr:EpsG family protein [Bacteroidales bacterium]